jgi:hypothetical protein
MEDIFISIVGTPAHISKLHTNNGIEYLLLEVPYHPASHTSLPGGV